MKKDEDDQHGKPAASPPMLLTSIGEASKVTLGQGRGSSEDKRRAYN
ncbi:albusnodin family lasso peptide [Actinomadura meridiana]